MKPIKVKDLKQGMLIVESEYGIDIPYVVLEDAKRVNDDGYDGWMCDCKAKDTGEVVSMFTSEEHDLGYPYLYLKYI